MALKKVQIFTDGACSGNPGPGGWAAILRYGQAEKVLSGGEAETTNNRMELLSVINALTALKERCEVTIYTDSKYVCDGINLGWAKKWKAAGWMRGKNSPAKNADLWDKLLSLLETQDAVFVWLKGHDGHPENERCDQIAVKESQKFK